MAQNLLNTTVNSSIKRTPFQALYGQCPRLTFESSEYENEKEDDPLRIRISNAEIMRENLRTKLEESNLIMQTKQHKKAHEREFQVDDLVYVQRNVLGGANYKLCPKFEGPFKITQKLSKYKYMVKHLVSGKEKKCHIDRLKMFTSDENRELNKQEDRNVDLNEEMETEEEDLSDSDREEETQTDIENQVTDRRDSRLRPIVRKNYTEEKYTFYRCVS